MSDCGWQAWWFPLLVLGAYFGFCVGGLLVFMVAGTAHRITDRIFDALLASRTPLDGAEK